MSHKIKSIIVASSLCAALLVSGISEAKDESHGAHSANKSEKMMKKMVKRLNLTASQQTQIEAINTERKTQIVALKPAMKVYQKKVKALIDAKNFDEKAFTELHNNNQNTFAAQAMIRAKHKFQMKKVLTAEQLKKFNKKKNKRNHKKK